MTTEEPQLYMRLSVKATHATWETLVLVADRENVSITEALRRLVGYGELVYRAVQVDGNDDILVRRGWEVERIVLEQVT